uniref:PPM-type phosphatase domain-containing protein n=1 Tax=Acrobeloides nanus TaxID=290746 RepID=A0A914CYJ1_9BILA
MEDKHFALPSFAVIEPQLKHNCNENGYFAVFDGHHGSECALYASSQFHLCLLDEVINNKEEKDDTLMERAFKTFDQRLTTRCEHEKIRSGTTAVCVYFKKNVAYLGWCGDSSIGIFKPTEVVTLSKRHTPNDEEEVKRIEEAGGMVVWIQGERRVNGVLNVSRSLGDIQGKPMISSEPDTRVYKLEENDYILFLASDGVWDTLPEEVIYEAAQKFITNNNSEDYHKMAQFIVDEAKEEGATDNLTLICVFLVPLDRLWNAFS